MDEDGGRAARAGSFGSVVDTYAAYRPGYPVDAVRWLVGERPARILELGAGTGKLTTVMHGLGHRVIATDPDPLMLGRLRTDLPQVEVVRARAEDIPLATGTVDVVVASQAYHWFDQDRALPEIARVLRAGGILALVWNIGDHRIPWVRKVFKLTEMPTEDRQRDPFEGSDVFRLVETAEFTHWQTWTKEVVTGYVSSTSLAATMPDDDRERLLRDAAALYDSYERGPDGLQMPWITHCYRGRVAGLEQHEEPPPLPPGRPGDADDDTVVISFD